jgi:hypothetical protein
MTSLLKFDAEVDIVEKGAAQIGHPAREKEDLHY